MPGAEFCDGFPVVLMYGRGYRHRIIFSICSQVCPVIYGICRQIMCSQGQRSFRVIDMLSFVFLNFDCFHRIGFQTLKSGFELQKSGFGEIRESVNAGLGKCRGSPELAKIDEQLMKVDGT